jgi:hypothetical protein
MAADETPLSQLDVQKSVVQPLCTCACVAAENKTSYVPSTGMSELHQIHQSQSPTKPL